MRRRLPHGGTPDIQKKNKSCAKKVELAPK